VQPETVNDHATTDGWERILKAAALLFHERGYAAVTLKEIAQKAGIKQASIYYHFPGGKEELFIEVMNRSMEEHKRGLELAAAWGRTLDEKLVSMGRWLLSQPAINLQRILESDLMEIDPLRRRPLERASYGSLMGPLMQVFSEAEARGEIVWHSKELVAAAFISIMGTIHSAARFTNTTPEEMLREMVRILLEGLTPRQ
jgi:TetR/AcrR family transcriptional regulator, cholesterol catabolism regulator